MQDLIQDSGEYFLALCNLHSLTLCNIRFEHISEDQPHTRFSAFRETLTYLSLETFTASFSAFVALVDYFPNIATLRLRPPELEPDEGPVPSLSRPLRGKLHIREAYANCPEFFDQFSKLDLEYEEFIIDTPLTMFGETEFVESALQIGTSVVKSLKLTAQLRRG